MKRLIFISLVLSCVQVIFAQNRVGIGTTTPQAQLHVNGTSSTSPGSVLFSSVDPAGPVVQPPASGAGRRMMWYPDKSVFRAGTVSGNQWDLDSLGDHSAAFGQNTVAASWGSFTAGVRSRSMSYASTALGYESNATGYAASAMGYKNIASGFGAAAVGRENTASGFVAIALGWENTSSGHGSMALGYQSSATDFYNIAMGDNALAIGRSSLSLGKGTRSVSWNSAALGKFNVGIGSEFPASGDVVLEVGNGSSNQNRSNAMTVFANGRVLIGSGSAASARLHVMDSSVVFTGPAISVSLPDVLPPVSGEGRRMMWYAPRGAFRAGGVSSTQWDINAIGDYSFAAGLNTQASGTGSVAFGISSRATSSWTVAMGENSLASSSHSIAIGADATASGSGSVAIGSFATATGVGAVALGRNTLANASYLVALGTGNIGGGNLTTWVPTDPLFEIGNAAPGTARRNAVTVIKNGNTGIGASNPGYLLHLRGPNDPNTGAVIALMGNSPDQEEAGRIRFLDGTAASNWRGGYMHYNGATDRLSIGTHNTSDNDPASDLNAITIVRSTRLVGMGTDSPTERLDVDGNARFRTIGSGASAGALHRTSNGTLTTSTSDARLKTDIVPIENALQKAMGMRGVTFRWMQDPALGQRIGFIAQEVEKVAPELVFTNEADGLKGVHYPETTALLLEALKQQQDMIEALKTRIEVLERKQ